MKGDACETLFLFDIDGTLTQPLTQDVPESTREALRLLQKNGHFVALATGRIQADAFAVAQSLGLSSAVSDGGECVTIDGGIQYHNGLPLDRCAEFLRPSMKKPIPGRRRCTTGGSASRRRPATWTR